MGYYVIVHPYFSVKDDNSLINYIKPEKHGDYNKYIKNLESLIDLINNDGSQALFLLEEQGFHNNREKAASLARSVKNSIVWLTRMGDAKLVNNDYNQLKMNNLKEVYIAGEWVWWIGKACLGKVVDELNNNMIKVKGVKGCVWPENKPSVLELVDKKSNLNDNLSIKRFYNNLVTII